MTPDLITVPGWYYRVDDDKYVRVEAYKYPVYKSGLVLSNYPEDIERYADGLLCEGSSYPPDWGKDFVGPLAKPTLTSFLKTTHHKFSVWLAAQPWVAPEHGGGKLYTEETVTDAWFDGYSKACVRGAAEAAISDEAADYAKVKASEQYTLGWNDAMEQTGNYDRLHRAAKDLYDYLWTNCPDIVDISANSELAGDGVTKRFNALKDALK